jgi:hypothetical protein
MMGAWFVASLTARSTFIGAAGTAASSLPSQAVVPATRIAVAIDPMIRIGSPLLNHQVLISISTRTAIHLGSMVETSDVLVPLV